MIPTNNGSTQPCSPLSSNCVVWQGPDIPCIDICNGDTVSDVVANLATEVCNLIDATCECNPVLAIDPSCLTVADPTNLDQVIQALIDKACESVTPDETLYTLPKCLTYRDPVGNFVTELPLQDFLTLLGNQVCTILESISVIEQSVENLSARVAVLEECVLPCEEAEKADFFVLSSCIQPGQEIPISTLTLALESEFCTFRDVVGSVALLNTAINAQCLFASTPQLAADGTLGNLTGWVNSPQTLAESNVNQWLAICDLHRAVADIQQNCCDELCSGVDIQYAYNIIEGGTGVPESINLNFSASTIPAGYNDCSGNSTVVITDSNGSSISQAINVTNLSNDPSGINISLAGLNVYQALVVSVQACVTRGSDQCSDSSSISVPLSIPCPSSVVVSAGGNNITVSFVNGLGTSVSYDIEAYVTGNPADVLGTTTITNPGTNVSHIFPGALPGSSYTVVISVSQGSITRICETREVSIAGSLCTDIETIATGVVPAIDDIFLGYEGDLGAGTATRYSFNVSSNEIVIESLVGGPGFCYSPILSNLSMVAGTINLTADWGDAAETGIDLSYSTDDITYSPPVPGVDGARSIPTGLSSGAVYIKAVTDCGGGSESLPTKWRYDFSTDTFQMIQSPSECIDSDLVIDACPAGVQVATQFLSCGTTTYSIPGAPATSYWYYIGKTEISGITRYLYAGWDQSTGVRKVVQCCACPAFILTDTIRVFAGTEAGYTTNITLPYVLGDGEPQITVITNPVGGTLTQSLTTTNEFTYVTIEKVPKNYGDTFQVQCSPTVGGVCSNVTVTVQIQMVPVGVKLTYRDQDIFCYVNTNGYTSAEGILLKAGLNDLKAFWLTEFGFTGNIYFIPTPDSRWLGYQKSIVDNGASWTQSPDPAWQALEELPSSWPGGTGVGVFKNEAMMFIFSNDSDGVYHDATLAAGFGGAVTQPATVYNEDLDAYIDAQSGTATSAWAVSLGITQPQFKQGLSMVLFPLTVPNSTGADAANILQMIAATTGELIPPAKFGIQTAANVGQVIQGIGASNPYTNTLFDYSSISGTLALLDQDKTSNYILDIGNGVNEEFTSLLTTAIKSYNDTYPSSGKPSDDRYTVEDCTSGDQYIVSITDHGCGTIGEGTVIKLFNPGATFSPGGGRADWVTLTNRCVTVLQNCNSAAAELATDLDSTYAECSSCTP